MHPQPENDVGAVVQQQLVQLRDVHHGLVHVADGAARVEVVDRGAGAVRGCAKSGPSVAFGPPPGGESRPALEHESSFQHQSTTLRRMIDED